MKLLLDQNLSRRLVKHLQEFYPGTCHISSVMPEDVQDRDIWFFAQQHGFAIVTKDNDFEQRSVLLGHPPKVVWIRLGNCRSDEVLALLLRSKNIIEGFEIDAEKSILPLPY